MALWKLSNLNKYGNLKSRIIYLPSNQPFSHGKGFGGSVMVSRFKYTHEHPTLPPSLFRSSIDCQTYIVPTYQKVLSETTLDDIEWVRPKKREVKVKEINEWKFKSESSDSIYFVRQAGSKLTCTCSGFWRVKDKNKGCKHIQEVKLNHPQNV
jgi:hypothetical protein